MSKLRVAVFMRGSTNKQTSEGQAKKKAKSGKVSARPASEDENELPLQKQRCMEYIESKKDEWEFTGLEYVEAGVSGFHTHVSKRVGLNDAFEDAKKGLYDVLLVYKLDRIGRRSVESLNHAVKFLRYCKIWVVDKNREFTNTGDADEIMNFIEFWSAKKASQDTKTRVTDMMKLIHKEGYWTGGNPPYGYRNHPTMSNMLEVIPQEADIVKDIYKWYTQDGMGMLRIAGLLNEKGFRSKTGRAWTSEAIRKILRNSVYKGYLSYGKTKNVEGEFGGYQQRQKNGEESISDKYWAEYDIVGEVTWKIAQNLKKQRYTESSDWASKPRTVPTRKGVSKGLLTSILYCECGSAMSYATASDWVDHKRTAKKDPYGIYRCLTRTRSGVSACGAKKGSYRVEEIEKIVVEYVKNYTKELIDSEMLRDIQKKTLEANKDITDRITHARQDVERWKKVKERLDSELMKILMGEDSSFSEQQLKDNYDKAVRELEQANRVMEELKALNSANGLTEVDLLKLQDLIGSWGDRFDNATHEEKKQLLGVLVKEVRLNGMDVMVKVSLEVSAFFEIVASLQTTDSRSPNSVVKTGTVDASLQTDDHRNYDSSNTTGTNKGYIDSVLNVNSIRRTFPTPIHHTKYLMVG